MRYCLYLTLYSTWQTAACPGSARHAHPHEDAKGLRSGAKMKNHSLSSFHALPTGLAMWCISEEEAP